MRNNECTGSSGLASNQLSGLTAAVRAGEPRQTGLGRKTYLCVRQGPADCVRLVGRRTPNRRRLEQEHAAILGLVDQRVTRGWPSAGSVLLPVWTAYAGPSQ